jgi:hypothetical protein
MKTYEYSGPDFDIVRAHPWTVANANSSNRYWDLKKNPALIRSSLEDFRPWSAWPGIDTFYRLLEWLNGADSILESNDCAFEGPRTNSTSQFRKGLEATGRLMILWRQLPLNLSRANTERLKEAIHHYLTQIDLELVYGAVGITVCQVKFVTLPLPEAQQLGVQLMLSFWAWGDTDEEVMGNLDRTFQNIWEALRAVEGEVKASTSSQVPGV